MTIAVARESREGEARVALVPELVGRLTGLGYDVLIEPDAGGHALLSDADYEAAGAVVDASAVEQADLLVSVQPPEIDVVRRLRRGAATVSFLPTGQEPEIVAALRDGGVKSFAMELVPRISRAQSMDALSSQASMRGPHDGSLVASSRQSILIWPLPRAPADERLSV
jgi:H+-translocating NAD(P) transhydrogenase subunit alpha